MRAVTRLYRLSCALALAVAGSAAAQTPTPTPSPSPSPTPTPPPGVVLTLAARTSYSFPNAGRYDGSNILLDPDGAVWAASGGENVVTKLSPDLKSVTRWPFPKDATPSSMLREGENLWITELGGFKIGRFNPTTGVLTEWPDVGRRPTALVPKGDGTFWLPETGGLLTHFNPGTGVFTYHRSGLFSLSYPWLDPDGSIWACDFVGSGIVHFAPDGLTGKFWSLPVAGVSPSKVIRGPDGALWISFYASAQIARFDPETSELKTYELGLGALPYDLANYRGRLVFSEQRNGFIGFLEPAFAEASSTTTLTAVNLSITTGTLTIPAETQTLTPTTDAVTLSGPSDSTGYQIPGVTQYFAGLAGPVWALTVDEARGRIFYGTVGSIATLTQAQPVPAFDQYFPAVASIQGRGTRWKTQVTVWSRATAALDVVLRLHPSSWIAGLLPSALLRLDPGQLVALDDPIANELNGPDNYGALRLAYSSPNDVLSVERVVSVREDGGTYGFARNAVRSDTAVAAGESGFVFTPPDPEAVRANAGIFVIEAARGTMSIVDSQGATHASRAFDWPAGYHFQGSTIFQSLGIEPLASARFVLAVSTGRVLAFGTAIDNATSDPYDLAAFGPRSGGTDLRLPGVARAAGLLGSGTITDLQLHSGIGSTAVLTFRPAAPLGQPTPPPSGSVAVVVPTGQVVTLRDVLATLGVSSGQGVLEITADNPVDAFARVTAAEPSGRHGYGIAGLPPAAAAEPGSRAVLLTATDTEASRTELLLANVSDSEASVTLQLTNPDGTSAGSRDVTLAPRAVSTLYLPWSSINGSRAEAGRLDVVPADGSGAVLAALVRQDTLTADADLIVSYVIAR